MTSVYYFNIVTDFSLCNKFASGLFLIHIGALYKNPLLLFNMDPSNKLTFFELPSVWQWNNKDHIIMGSELSKAVHHHLDDTFRVT